MEVQKEITANPALPPNWNEHFENTITSLVPYKLFPVASNTLEYATIAALLSPLQVTEAEQIVNPDLWSRFVNTRKQILQSKTDDIEILSKFGLNEKEIAQRLHISSNFDKDAQVAACPYNDNIGLLFHCTRSQNNVDSILLQGLDERLGNVGKLGRGIYFADDPTKSMAYDGCSGTMFIFMVLLGDCLSVDHFPNTTSLVREPEKQKAQQRNLSDIHFDSTVAYPVGSEYVIYNRYQCCPIYKIRYARNSTQNHSDKLYTQWRQRLPPFVWTPSTPTSIPMCKQSSDTDWPFNAKIVFKQMGVQQEEETVPQLAISASEMKNLLKILSSLGFSDDEMNSIALKENSYDLDRCVIYLLEQGAMTDQPTESEILDNNKSALLSYLGSTDAQINTENLNHLVMSSMTDVSKAEPGSNLNTEISESMQNKVAVLSSMGFTDVEISDALRNNSNDLDRSVDHLLTGKNDQSLTEHDILNNNKLAMLLDLGFTNAALNLKTLKKNSYDLDRSVNDLLEVGDIASNIPFNIFEKPDDNHESAKDKRRKISSFRSTVMPQTECLICANEYEVTAANWKDFECRHRLCTVCYKQMEITRTTMEGVLHTFTKCPFCMVTSGVEIGTCPNGTMITSVEPTSCEGYENHKTICIKYDVNNELYRLSRIAFLPDNDEGNGVLRLLKIAWNRRLCFTIGTSATTGQPNVLVWNIHHKTAPRGGIQSHGFPDATYMERVKLELKRFGIE